MRQRIILKLTDFDNPRLTLEESGENKNAPRAGEATTESVALSNN